MQSKLLMISRSRFQTKRDVLLKCSLMIENIQTSVDENFTPIINTRYRSAELYQKKYFNDSILRFKEEHFGKSYCEWYA